LRFNFSGAHSGTQFSGHKKNEGILEELKVEPGDEELRLYKSDLLRSVTRMNSNRIPKIAVNYRPNARRCLGRPFKDTIIQGRNRSNNAKLLTDDDDDDDDDDDAHISV